jgi:hypothetical protein
VHTARNTDEIRRPGIAGVTAVPDWIGQVEPQRERLRYGQAGLALDGLDLVVGGQQPTVGAEDLVARIQNCRGTRCPPVSTLAIVDRPYRTSGAKLCCVCPPARRNAASCRPRRRLASRTYPAPTIQPPRSATIPGLPARVP